MRQRLGLARCLIHDPRVLILDEPASGLDPRARIEIQEILRTLGSMGKTVLISSHILSELRYLCNKIGIVDNGRLIYSGTIKEALEKARTARRLQVRLVDRQDAARELIETRPEVAGVHIEDGFITIELKPEVEDFSFVAEMLVHAGFRLLTLREEEILLEDAFIKLTGPAAEPPEVPVIASTGGT
jgi:ABC-2 type transport system ATP-binding protein